MAEIWGIALGTVAAAGIGAYASSQAAGQQAGAAKNAQGIAQGEFKTITGQEQPFMNAGYLANDALRYGMGLGPSDGSAFGGSGLTYGSLNAPFTADYMQKYSPAYKFQLQQGQQGTLNQDASTQGVLSGASLKDLISFNQGYANTAFNNAFNQYQTQNQNIFGRLSDLANRGQNAASNTGQAGVGLANSAAQSATNIGTANAAGTIGIANNLGGGASSLGAYLGAYGQRGSGDPLSPVSLNTNTDPWNSIDQAGQGAINMSGVP